MEDGAPTPLSLALALSPSLSLALVGGRRARAWIGRRRRWLWSIIRSARAATALYSSLAVSGSPPAGGGGAAAAAPYVQSPTMLWPAQRVCSRSCSPPGTHACHQRDIGSGGAAAATGRAHPCRAARRCTWCLRPVRGLSSTLVTGRPWVHVLQCVFDC